MRTTIGALELARGYDPAVEPRFETLSKARAEDQLRANILARVARSNEEIAAEAMELSSRLQPQPEGRRRRRIKRQTPAQTLASSVFMRILRRHIISQVWRLVEEGDYDRIAAVTLIPSKWACDTLVDFDPRKTMQSVRMDLSRRGLREADGWMIGFLHGEFGSASEKFHPHVHLIATDGMIDVLNRLKGGSSTKYRSSDDVPRPVHVSENFRQPHPSPLTYILQAFWPMRFRGYVGDDKVSSGRRRLPDHLLSHQLMWIDRWKVEDFAFLAGLTIKNKSLFGTR